MARPTRIQRKRTKGWRMPSNTVCVTRPGRWGNPYRVIPDDSGDRDGFWAEGPGRCAFFADFTVAASYAVHCFEHALCAGELVISVDDVRGELRGKTLACWCPVGSPCHADVLLKVANG
jgi:hypothetical protein